MDGSLPARNMEIRMNRNANAVRAMALGIALASAGAIAEEPEGLDGEWKGRWNGGGQIRMTVERATEASPKVTYCFKRRCWSPRVCRSKEAS